MLRKSFSKGENLEITSESKDSISAWSLVNINWFMDLLLIYSDFKETWNLEEKMTEKEKKMNEPTRNKSHFKGKNIS